MMTTLRRQRSQVRIVSGAPRFSYEISNIWTKAACWLTCFECAGHTLAEAETWGTNRVAATPDLEVAVGRPEQSRRRYEQPDEQEHTGTQRAAFCAVRSYPVTSIAGVAMSFPARPPIPPSFCRCPRHGRGSPSVSANRPGPEGPSLHS